MQAILNKDVLFGTNDFGLLAKKGSKVFLERDFAIRHGITEPKHLQEFVSAWFEYQNYTAMVNINDISDIKLLSE